MGRLGGPFLKNIVMVLDPNSAYAVVASVDALFTDAGITSVNTRVIYRVNKTLQSYVPGRSINQINGFATGVGYYIITSNLPLDLTGFISDGSSGGGGPLYNDDFDI